jgi:two-component system copper resistance phosphate regulon response regulator CusR
MRILVVEDEPGIADFLTRGLEAEGYEVEATVDGAAGEEMALSGRYDLLLLDLMLPGRSGLDIVEAVRGAGIATPVILLTARGEVADRVKGLDAGATDYVTKPFAFEELAARVRAALRVALPGDARVVGGGIEVDLVRRQVTRDGRSVPLSGREIDLLALLARNAGVVVTREQALRAVWGYEHDPGTNALGVYIGYLRRKLGEPDPIETVRSVGYRLRANG